MTLELLDDPADARLDAYRDLRAAERFVREGLVVAEGPTVVRTLLTAPRFRTRSVLVSPAQRERLRDVLDAAPAVYVASDAVIARVAGFGFHRGAVALGERCAPASLDSLVAGAPRLLVACEDLAQADNVGAVFRNAHAFGAAGVLLSPGCCDPLYRKAVRTSAGAALHVPFARAASWPGDLARLRDAGLRIVALTPRADATPLDAVRLPSDARVVLLVGAEGPGLGDAALAAADDAVRIPMAPGVDSLNVATAAGIALWALAGRTHG